MKNRFGHNFVPLNQDMLHLEIPSYFGPQDWSRMSQINNGFKNGLAYLECKMLDQKIQSHLTGENNFFTIFKSAVLCSDSFAAPGWVPPNFVDSTIKSIIKSRRISQLEPLALCVHLRYGKDCPEHEYAISIANGIQATRYVAESLAVPLDLQRPNSVLRYMMQRFGYTVQKAKEVALEGLVQLLQLHINRKWYRAS
jgi:hypothetical protein